MSAERRPAQTPQERLDLDQDGDDVRNRLDPATDRRAFPEFLDFSHARKSIAYRRG